MVYEILTYLHIGVICITSPEEKDRGIIIIGAGYQAGKIALLVEELKQEIPLVVCHMDNDEDFDLSMLPNLKRDKSIIIVGGDIENIDLSRLDKSGTMADLQRQMLSETAFEIQRLLDDAIIYDDFFDNIKESYCCERLYHVPTYHSPKIAVEWGRYFAGVPP